MHVPLYLTVTPPVTIMFNQSYNMPKSCSLWYGSEIEKNWMGSQFFFVRAEGQNKLEIGRGLHAGGRIFGSAGPPPSKVTNNFNINNRSENVKNNKKRGLKNI